MKKEYDFSMMKARKNPFAKRLQELMKNRRRVDGIENHAEFLGRITEARKAFHQGEGRKLEDLDE